MMPADRMSTDRCAGCGHYRLYHHRDEPCDALSSPTGEPTHDRCPCKEFVEAKKITMPDGSVHVATDEGRTAVHDVIHGGKVEVFGQ